MSSGYDENFLGEGIKVQHPTLTGEAMDDSLNNGEIYDFQHFSLVMNQKRKFAIYTAHNIDQDSIKSIGRRGIRWWLDSRIGHHNQTGNEAYRNNPWDRGHLVRRKSVCWGSTDDARKANKDSFCYANAALQHKHFNQDEWLKLEDWMLNYSGDEHNKLSVFTGPILKETDRSYRQVKIPAAYWKVIFFVGPDGDLESRAFIMKQDEFWHDTDGANFVNLTNYQVTLSEISDITGVEWDNSLYDTNPLWFSSNDVTDANNIATPERNPISSEKDLILARSIYSKNKDIV